MRNINKKVVTLTLGLMAFGSFLNAGELTNKDNCLIVTKVLR